MTGMSTISYFHQSLILKKAFYNMGGILYIYQLRFETETRLEASLPEATCPGSRCGEVYVPVPRNKGGLWPPISEMGIQDRLRYFGPWPWSEFRTKVAIWKMMRIALADGKSMKLIPDYRCGQSFIYF